MYGIFTYIYHKNQPNVGKYTIHGSYGINKFSHSHSDGMGAPYLGLRGEWSRWSFAQGFPASDVSLEVIL